MYLKWAVISIWHQKPKQQQQIKSKLSKKKENKDHRGNKIGTIETGERINIIEVYF